jgi:hypothetical protein
VSDVYSMPDSSGLQFFGVNTSATVFEFSAAPMVRTGALSFSLGPVFDIFFARVRTVEEVPVYATRSNLGPSTTIRSAAIGRLALAMSAGVEVPVYNRPTIAASLRYDPYVNRFRPLADALQWGAELRIPLVSDDRDSETAPPAEVEAAAPRIVVGGRELDREAVLPVDIQYRIEQRYDELPLRIPLDSVTRLSMEAVSAFSEQALTPQTLARNALNVLASRARRTGEVVTLSGDTAALAPLRSYLESVWHVRARLSSRSVRGNDVDISGNSAVLLLPVSRSVVERQSTIPPIVVEKGDTAGYRLLISSGPDTLLRRTVRSGSDNSVTELPAHIDLERPLTVTLIEGTHQVVRTIHFEEGVSDTVSRELAITFRPSYNAPALAPTRAQLLEKLLHTRILSATLSGSRDTEADDLLVRLGSVPVTAVSSPAPWTLTVKSDATPEGRTAP